MPPSLGRKLRKVETVAHLGPEDPEDLLGADALAYPRTHSRVSLFGGLVGLEPVLATETVQNGLRPLPARRKNGNGEQHNLVQNHQAHLRADPLEFSKQLSLWATGTGWRAYNDYIGGRVFYEGYSDSCVRAIMTSPQVLAQQHQVTEQRLALLHLPNGPEKLAKRARIEKLVREETSKIANGLVARMDSVRFLRFFGALVNNLLVRLYHQGIEISIPEYARFKEIAVLAAKKKQSLLIVPCHKSHIDYLTISWLFFRLGLSLPHIVAGENLNMPIVGPTLAKCGAFFIRRTFGPDPLYNVVVKDYIEQLLANGKNIECFIEGSRSRTGKLLPPKLGILKYVCDAVENGITDDVWLCPISLQYDRVIETESYINELLGNPKEKESLSGLLLNTRVIQFELGRIDVRFQKPFSLRAWLDEQKKHRSEVGPSGKRPKSDQATLLKALGYEVLSGINDCAIIMPAGLVGTTLLTMRGRGVGKTELIKRILWLKGAIETRGGRVADFGDMPVEEVVERTLLVLKDLIGEKRDLIEPTYHPLDRFQLSFYRNQVIHLFVEESMLCAVLYTRVKAGGAAPSQRMERNDALRELHFLSRLLQNEFVYQGDGLEANAERTIASLKDDQVILVEGELIGLSPEERAAGRNNFDFFCFLIWPFIETYWLAAASLFALTPTSSPPSAEQPVAWFAEKAFQASAQLLAKTLFAQGDVSYWEAVNQGPLCNVPNTTPLDLTDSWWRTATLSNAFQRMVDLGVILTRRSTTGNKPVALMALHPDWVPLRLEDGEIAPEGKLWSFVDRLSRFRREGKNRRDNRTVSARVFMHCSAISPEVVEYSAFTYDKPASDFWAEKRTANL
ncbi:hypothetical protein JCM1841_003045 [Sporobolomyces salmonicolor]